MALELDFSKVDKNKFLAALIIIIGALVLPFLLKTTIQPFTPAISKYSKPRQWFTTFSFC